LKPRSDGKILIPRKRRGTRGNGRGVSIQRVDGERRQDEGRVRINWTGEEGREFIVREGGTREIRGIETRKMSQRFAKKKH